jgi:hypothetical protein
MTKYWKRLPCPTVRLDPDTSCNLGLEKATRVVQTYYRPRISGDKVCLFKCEVKPDSKTSAPGIINSFNSHSLGLCKTKSMQKTFSDFLLKIYVFGLLRYATKLYVSASIF